VDDDEIRVLARRFTTDKNLDRINYRAFANVISLEGSSKAGRPRPAGSSIGVNTFGIW
jgi:hypothetical protein